MSDCHGYIKSNYFAVTDKEAFKELCFNYRLNIKEQGNLVGFENDYWDDSLCIADEVSTFNDYSINDGGLSRKVADLLCDNEVAVIMEILRYSNDKAIFGNALAVNNKGMVRDAALSSIYDKAAELGTNFTYAEDAKHVN